MPAWGPAGRTEADVCVRCQEIVPTLPPAELLAEGGGHPPGLTAESAGHPVGSGTLVPLKMESHVGGKWSFFCKEVSHASLRAGNRQQLRPIRASQGLTEALSSSRHQRPAFNASDALPSPSTSTVPAPSMLPPSAPCLPAVLTAWSPPRPGLCRPGSRFAASSQLSFASLCPEGGILTARLPGSVRQMSVSCKTSAQRWPGLACESVIPVPGDTKDARSDPRPLPVTAGIALPTWS